MADLDLTEELTILALAAIAWASFQFGQYSNDIPLAIASGLIGYLTRGKMKK
jgi:hypothetical protein